MLPPVLAQPRPIYTPASYGASAQRDPRLERQLAGPAFSTGNPRTAAATSSETATPAAEAAGGGGLDTLLRPRVTPAVQAQMLPTQRLLLPKGAFLDCTLETAIDSTLPGMTTCVLATDTFSADGTVVLLERGTKLVGETRGQLRQGAARVFVLWTEARTPRGIVVPLASPGTDELGRSGLPGDVSRHFFERFGAAILISVIDGAIQAAVQRQHQAGDTLILNPSSTQDILTEVLRSTIDIPPTVVKPQGDRIQVLVARDLDFRSVYELRPVGR
jgi:type IV secretion system protein VirB10